MNVESMIEKLSEKRSRIDSAINALRSLTERRGRPRKMERHIPHLSDFTPTVLRKKRRISPEGLAAIRRGIAKRWAKYHKEQARKAK